MVGTYSNVSNHPRILRLHEPGSLPPRIRIDKKTGFPVVEMPAGSEPPKPVEEADEEEGESDYEGEFHPSLSPHLPLTIVLQTDQELSFETEQRLLRSVRLARPV